MVFNFEADGVGPAGGEVLGDGFRAQGAATAGVDLGAVSGDGKFALGFELFRGAEAAVGLAIGEEALGVLGVEVEALGLAVGAVGALVGQAGALVPVEAEPAEVLHELGFEAGLGALEVGVFDAEDELAAGAAGEEPVVEGGARVAHVEQAGGGGGKPDAGFGGGHGTTDNRW